MRFYRVRGNLAQIKMSSTKVVFLRSYNIEDPSVRVQALCLTFGGNIVLPAHAVPSIRELYHRKWVITLLAALGPGSSFSLKKHYTDRLLGQGMDDLQSRNLFSQYIQFSFGLFDRVQFDTRRMFLPKFFCLASVFWSLLLAVPPCSRCF